MEVNSVRQVLFVTEACIELAQECEAHVLKSFPALKDGTNGEAAQWWMTPCALDDGHRLVTLCGGHLASASTRIATLRQLASRLHGQRGKLDDNRALATMLRNNIGHLLPRKRDGVRWNKRQMKLLKLRVFEMIPRIEKALQRVKRQLNAKGYSIL